MIGGKAWRRSFLQIEAALIHCRDQLQLKAMSVIIHEQQ